MPISDWKDRYAAADWMVKLESNSTNNLLKISVADCFQVRSLSKRRMIRKLGEVSSVKVEEIEIALAKVLKIK